MDNNVELLEKISMYVVGLFDQYQGNDLLYHNLEHTKSVVKRSLEIAANYTFNESELFIITAGAWFHDTGNLVGGVNLHEDRSITIMRNFLEQEQLPENIINKIEGCICATKLPQHPRSLLEKIVCDADTYNLGTKDFLKTDKLLKKEYELRNIAINRWEEKTLKLLLRHKYFTPYCQTLLNSV
ncbi:MAG: HD domain-containing protein [Ginsengibacter sp.]